MSVDVLSLAKSKRDGERPIAEIERVDQFFGEEFLVALAPPQPRQIVAQGGGQIAKGAVASTPSAPCR
jgi:hypothetical protein